MGFRDNWSQATPYLAFCVFTFACGDLVFGIDTSMFGSLQALPSWLNTFGTEQPDGKMALTTYQKAIANSVVFIGRLLGCTTFEPVVEYIGFKKMLVGIGCLQIIAVVIELVAKDWIVFTIGRVVAYLAVGYIENTVPTYSAEIAPSALRGFCAGLLTPVITMSSVWGAGMCQAFATETGRKGWMIPVGVQAIPAVMILVLAPFTVESPRWLITHNRKEQALKSLKKLRPKDVASQDVCEAEIGALHAAIQQDKICNNARWRDIFKGTYFRRALICSTIFFLYQATGNSFYNAYGPTFFVSVGLGAKSFTYATVVQLVGAIGSLMAIFLTDYLGRRPLIITGAALLVLFDCLIAGFGTKVPHTQTANNVVVASFVMMLWSTKISWATHCYLIGSELGGTQMRKKIIMVGTTVDLIAAWLVSFTSPYIMNEPYGGIGGNIGYVFGGIAALGLVFAILVVPELRGRSLEEVDELFERPRWGWQYASIKTSGYGAAIAQIERGNMDEAQTHKDDVDDGVKDDTTHIEDVRR